ncbi:MAG TPA: FecR domain-containing protein [Candidatus Dormibacteraeota bacterium]|nr:FecR domain-containing protein [Candidatus Dormibacteraeota bacterium]
MTKHTPTDPRHTQPHHRFPRVEVYWTTVTYKTVILCVLAGMGLVFGGIYVAKPELYTAVINQIDKSVGNPDVDPVNADQKHARFVNLEGHVQVKKVNSVQWVEATLSTSLDKGDLVRTGSDSDARISFADGTNYTVKPDTLVTVEENSTEGNNRPTSVAVSIQTGQVDLATPNLRSPDSKAIVRSEDATTQLHSNSRVDVKFDPAKKESEVVVSAGSAQVQRGQERIDLAQNERATIPNSGTIQKSSVLAPPDLVEPLNLAPVIAENPRSASVHFEWKPVPEAVSYTLRISPTAMFTRTVFDKRFTVTSADVSGLDAGDYFWNVTATDAKKQSSQPSDIFRFSLVAQGKSQDMVLEITDTRIVGRVVEIVGKTEPGAALIVNGQPVPNIAPDGTFRHFTEPLEPGQHTIVVVGQNRRGGTGHAQRSIVVPK